MSKAKLRKPKAAPAKPKHSAAPLVKALQAMPVKHRGAAFVELLQVLRLIPGIVPKTETMIDKPRERTEGERSAAAIEALDEATEYLGDARDIAMHIGGAGRDGAAYLDDVTLSRSCRLLIEEAGRNVERVMQASGKKFGSNEARFIESTK